MRKVTIVGAGASGLMCAARLRYLNKDIDITLLEKNNKIGKKLLLTGNGKCNLGNTNIDSKYYFPNPNSNYINNTDINILFNELGLLLNTENNGYIYPFSYQASSVVSFFDNYLNENNINIIYNYDVKSIEKDNNKYIINKDLQTDILVLSTGGRTYPKTGSNGEGYHLLKTLGHNITRVLPSLSYFNVIDNKYFNLLDGVRINAKASLYDNENNIYSELGQVQFTKDNLSGICIFNISLVSISKNIDNPIIKLDLMPNFSDLEVYNILKQRISKNSDKPLEYILNMILNSNVSKYIKEKYNNICVEKDISKIVEIIKNLDFSVSYSNDYDKAQVTYGGVPLEELKETLESKYNDNLYIIGELLDITGLCGGYNLNMCFQTGQLVAKDIAKKY